MNGIYTLVSDSELREEFITSVRCREVEQKFFYEGEYAKEFYKNSFIDGYKSKVDIYKTIINKAIPKNKKIAIISLGCGNSEDEKKFIEYAINEHPGKYIIDFFGVDSSEEMLEISLKNMEKVSSINKTFIRADFSSKKFKIELEQITKGYEKRIFTFFGNTFGNINHTNIIDILGGILIKGEKIWLSIAIRNGVSEKDNFNLLKSYTNLLEKDTNIFLNALLKHGIKKNDGELKILSLIEKSINAQKFHFYFKLKKKKSIIINGEKVIFLKGEKVFLIRIYEYEEEGLKNFFKEHNFKFVDGKIEKGLFSKFGQFLFEKE